MYVCVCVIQYRVECSTTTYLVVVIYRLVTIVCRIEKHAGQDTGNTHLFTMLVYWYFIFRGTDSYNVTNQLHTLFKFQCNSWSRLLYFQCFKITLNIKITLDSVTNFPHTLYQLQNGSAAEDDVVDIDQHQTMQGPSAERPNPNPSQVRCYENNSTYSNQQ